MFLGLLAVLGFPHSAKATQRLPFIQDSSPDDFVCVSGYVYDAVTQEPLSGVAVCVFPEGYGADSSGSFGTIYENGVEYPLDHIPDVNWIGYTDAFGKFAIRHVPANFLEVEFAGVVYKPGYIPQFPKQIQPEGGASPFYGLGFSLQPSGS